MKILKCLLIIIAVHVVALASVLIVAGPFKVDVNHPINWDPTLSKESKLPMFLLLNDFPLNKTTGVNIILSGPESDNKAVVAIAEKYGYVALSDKEKKEFFDRLGSNTDNRFEPLNRILKKEIHIYYGKR